MRALHSPRALLWVSSAPLRHSFPWLPWQLGLELPFHTRRQEETLSHRSLGQRISGQGPALNQHYSPSPQFRDKQDPRQELREGGWWLFLPGNMKTGVRWQGGRGQHIKTTAGFLEVSDVLAPNSDLSDLPLFFFFLKKNNFIEI